MSNLANYNNSVFEEIKHIDESGEEFWYARELQNALEYTEWRNFLRTIDKAKFACKNSFNSIEHHFVDVNKMVHIGVSEREIQDIVLSRYACYLIVMNGDTRKEIISLGQTYFAIKTREKELEENFDKLSEEQKRLSIRQELSQHNRCLAESAKNAGIEDTKDYAIFQNYGYKGLYGGLDAKAIHEKKNLKKSQKILDYMGSTELAANLFRATQTDEKLRRENIIGKDNANKMHYEVGAEVRSTIKRLGGTMPEDLPTPDKSIKQIEREHTNNKLLKPKSKKKITPGT